MRAKDLDQAAVEAGAPDVFFCPISLKLLRDPVLLSTGQTCAHCSHACTTAPAASRAGARRGHHARERSSPALVPRHPCRVAEREAARLQVRAAVHPALARRRQLHVPGVRAGAGAAGGADAQRGAAQEHRGLGRDARAVAAGARGAARSVSMLGLRLLAAQRDRPLGAPARRMPTATCSPSRTTRTLRGRPRPRRTPTSRSRSGCRTRRWAAPARARRCRPPRRCSVGADLPSCRLVPREAGGRARARTPAGRAGPACVVSGAATGSARACAC